MLMFGHLAAGYLVTYFFLKFFNIALNAGEINTLLIIGTIFGAIVDLDFISFFAKNKSLKLKEKESHRDQFSHAPLVWLIIGLLIYVLPGTYFASMMGLVIWISVWSHFVFDSIEHGIMWFWPVSKRRYFLFENKKFQMNDKDSFLKYYGKFYFKFYPRTKTFWVELVVIILFFLVYFKVI